MEMADGMASTAPHSLGASLNMNARQHSLSGLFVPRRGAVTGGVMASGICTAVTRARPQGDQMIICCTSEQRLFNRIEVIMSLAEAASSCCHWTFAARRRSLTLLHHESDIVVTVTDDEDG